MIEIRGLKKTYDKKVLFNGLDLKINEGDRLALVGPNGVGKTTLIEIICGLREMDGGEISFPQGKNNFFQSLGVHFQSGEYPFGIRVKDLIYLYSNVYKKEISKKIRKKFQILELEEKDLNELSFGQRKRVDLFLILALNFNFFILDEVTSGMDILMRIKILDSLQKHLKKNKCGMIYVSHNMEEISLFCNRLVVLDKKKIVFDQKISSSFDVHEKVKTILSKTK